MPLRRVSVWLAILVGVCSGTLSSAVETALPGTISIRPTGIKATGRQNRTALSASSSRRISFVNDVVPALTRAGCNQGACHGAAQGKNGFKLSLRGFAPDLDYLAITHQAWGRRVSLAQPAQSLLLRKPLLQIPHRGGMALRRGTPEYAILRRWLQQGAPGPDSRDPHLIRLEVQPSAQTLAPRAGLSLRVYARFSDGTRRDVTYWTRYGTNDENIATVGIDGAVKTAGEGETAITVAYQDKVAFARITVPYSNRTEARDYARLPRNNYIDEQIYRKLADLHLWPSPPVADAGFARRLYLDLIGTLPTPDELKAFVADRAANKREHLIDTLMERP